MRKLTTEQRFRHVHYAMLDRCTKSAHPAYKNYGGRGIKVEWESYDAFKCDMYDSYVAHKQVHPSTSLDRIDNDSNYCKENCRWITKGEQLSNKRNNVRLTSPTTGETLTGTQWAKKLNISKQALFQRLQRGLPLEKVLAESK